MAGRSDDDTAAPRSPRVFISYAHEPGSGSHRDLVRRLWLFLRSHGIDAHLDVVAAGQRQDWAVWMADQIRDADHILVIASPAYRARAQGEFSVEVGRGVQWEARLIRDAFYRDQHDLNRWVPVVLPGQTIDGVPDFLTAATTTVYHVRGFSVDGAEPLLRLLTGQPAEVQPALGPLVVLPPHRPGPDEESPAGSELTTEVERVYRAAAGQGDRRASGHVPTPAPTVVFQPNPTQRAVLLVGAVLFSALFVGDIIQAIFAGPSLQSGIEHVIAPLCLAPLGIVIFVAMFRARLVLTRQGVYVVRWKTTFIQWNQIKAVQVGRRPRDGLRHVMFVLDNRSERPWVPADDRRTGGRQFDQKVSTIQQWHARFCSPEPS